MEKGSRGCFYKGWMGVVGSGGKSFEGETFKCSVFVDSRVESQRLLMIRC